MKSLKYYFNSGKQVIINEGILLCLFLIVIVTVSCNKLVEVKPPSNAITGDNVYSTDATAIAVLTDIYSKLSSSSFTSPDGGVVNFSLFGGLVADELVLYKEVTSNSHLAYYRNNMSVTTGGYEYWNGIYPLIFICNSAVEGISQTTTLTPAVQQQLLGEAKFIRAFLYFYMTNLYGKVPLAISSNYVTNSRLSNASQEEVYQQVIADLKEAEELLNANYLNGNLQSYGGSADRVRPAKGAASAMLARVYLFTNDWANAEQEATKVISNTSLYDTTSLNNVFLKTSKEAIWQLQPVQNGRNTEDARVFVLAPSGPTFLTKPAYLSADLYSSFEAGDKRKTDWISSILVNGVTYNYPNKYKVFALNAPVTEYNTILRVGEQYLIRAEARAQQNNISGAQQDLNVIRKRARLGNTTAINKEGLLAVVLLERRNELFTEWGHRWLDLKRTNMVDAVMTTATAQKGGTWQTTDKLFPIPKGEIDQNINLQQNDGY